MENMPEKRTDLAIEAHEIYTQTENETKVPGVKIDIEQHGKITVSRVRVLNREGEKAINNPVGTYRKNSHGRAFKAFKNQARRPRSGCGTGKPQHNRRRTGTYGGFAALDNTASFSAYA